MPVFCGVDGSETIICDVSQSRTQRMTFETKPSKYEESQPGSGLALKQRGTADSRQLRSYTLSTSAIRQEYRSSFCRILVDVPWLVMLRCVIGTISGYLYRTKHANIFPQGLSYTLSTLTVPSLLELPSASSAARAFNYLITTAKKHLGTLTGVSASSFLLAFFLSPKPVRHPYLLYTSILVASSGIVVSDFVAPYLFISKSSSSSSSSPTASLAAAAKKEKKERAAANRAQMEASYEVLGSSSSAHSDEDIETEEEVAREINGEEVRTEVEGFLKKQMVQTAISGLGFLMAVVGIWGDGVAQVFQNDVVIIQA
jgi:autophagy-related protein 33